MGRRPSRSLTIGDNIEGSDASMCGLANPIRTRFPPSTYGTTLLNVTINSSVCST